jgi:Peptidase A4 family
VKIRTAAAAALLSGLAATAATALPASAAVTQVPSGSHTGPYWAGYYAVPANGQSPEAVFGSFTVPRVDCAQSIGLPRSAAYGSLWVGIGGMSDDIRSGKKAWLEQAGVQIRCMTSKSQPVYEPFWETVSPDGGKRDTHGSRVFTENGRSATVSPGDHITAVTYYNSYLKTGKFTLRVDVSRPGADPVTYYQTTDIPAGAYPGRTAEVITERTRGPSGWPAWTHASAGMVQLGAIRYSSAMYLTHRPGEPKPVGVAVAQYPLKLEATIGVKIGLTTYGPHIVIDPSPPFVTIPGNREKDGFFTSAP